MPTYDYKCSQCGNEFEEIQSMKDALLTKCPTCGKETLKRLIGGGGVIFKGSGFYQTDYAKIKESSGHPSDKDGSAAKKESSPTIEKKTETKPAADTTTTSSPPKKE